MEEEWRAKKKKSSVCVLFFVVFFWRSRGSATMSQSSALCQRVLIDWSASIPSTLSLSLSLSLSSCMACAPIKRRLRRELLQRRSPCDDGEIDAVDSSGGPPPLPFPLSLALGPCPRPRHGQRRSLPGSSIKSNRLSIPIQSRLINGRQRGYNDPIRFSALPLDDSVVLP